MDIIQDESYEELAAEWQFQMIVLLKESLKKQGIEGETAKAICGDFAFNLAMLQDQGELKVEGDSYRAVICFDNFKGKLAYNSEDECQLHEYAFGNTDEAFEN